MKELEPRDRELVALGAAMGSNCVPCIQYHIPEARKAGLTDAEIRAAIELADRVRQVPARKTLQAASDLLPAAEAAGSAQPRELMAEMMSKMMGVCGHRETGGAARAKPGATGGGCGCG